MEVVFDPAKDEANRAKHGLPLAFGARILADPHRVILPSIRPIDGEDRYKVIGEVEGKLYTGAHVVRDRSLRFMSVRRSNDGEERVYRRP